MKQTSFNGGLVTALNFQRLPENAYGFAQNVRLSGGTLEPIYSPVRASVPPGNINASFAFGRWLVLVIDGIVWYRDVISSLVFDRIPDVALVPPTVHGCVIPSRYLNYQRVLSETGAVRRNFNAPTRSSDPGLFLTDGSSQPIVVYPTVSGLGARTTVPLSAFDVNTSEYVPTGLFPHWTGSKLLLIRKDSAGNYTQIVQSVTGEPLNFAIIIDDDGRPAGGGMLPYSIGPDPVVGIRRMPDESFLVQTKRESVVVVPDDTSLFFEDFNEPTFRAIRRFDVGSTGLNAALEARGRDIIFVSRYGIHSINAIQERASRQVLDSFGSDIHTLFSESAQVDPAVVAWGDELLFAVNTIYGQLVVVFDMFMNRFVSVDDYRIGKIVNFLVIAAEEDDRIFAQTETGLFELFVGESPLAAAVYVGEEPTSGQTHIAAAELAFVDVTSPTDITLSTYTDKALHSYQTRTRGNTRIASSVAFPISSSGKTGIYETFAFTTTNADPGTAHGILVTWTGEATLSAVGFATSSTVSLPQPSTISSIKYVLHGGSSQNIYSAWHPLDRFVGCGYYTELWTTHRAEGLDIRALGPEDSSALATTPGPVSVVDGDVEFFLLCLTPNHPKGTTAFSVQYNWLQQALEASTARWKIVICPVFPPTNPAYQWPFKTWGAHLVVSASEPNYQRHLLNDGLQYLNVGASSRAPEVSTVPDTGIAITSVGGSIVLEIGSTNILAYFNDKRQDCLNVLF